MNHSQSKIRRIKLLGRRQSSKFNSRKIEIKRMREEGFTLSKIAKRYHISNERVRQILLPKLSIDTCYCKSHKKTYLTTCQYCEIEKEYKKKIKKLANQLLEIECQRLSKPNRKAELVIQRKILIKYLRNKYKLNFIEIAKMLKRDHTSIMSLYYQN